MSGAERDDLRGYVYVEMSIPDWDRFRAYTALSAPAVRAAGGLISCPEEFPSASKVNSMPIAWQ